jgi:hypothetical protein
VGRERAGLADQADSVPGEPGGEGVDRRGVRRAERDEVDALVVGLAQADRLLLG